MMTMSVNYNCTFERFTMIAKLTLLDSITNRSSNTSVTRIDLLLHANYWCLLTLTTDVVRLSG